MGDVPRACPMPFFDRYDMAVEFDRRVKPFFDHLRESWPRHATATADDLTSEIEFELCPIELDLPSIVIEEGRMRVYNSRYRQGPAQIWSRFFTGYVPYVGDDELWHLYPAPISSPHPDGEVFRHRLVLESHAPTQEAAAAEFQARVERIKEITDVQVERIAVYEVGLPALVMSELRRLHREHERPSP